MGIFKINIQVINKFLNRFQHIFSQKQFEIFSFFIYAMFKEYRRYSLLALANKANIDYQRFQYFFSESNWSTEDINHACINLIESQRPTRSTKDGVLAIDDTANPKPFAKKTEGVKFQYCNPLKREERCNVVVFSVFSSPSKKFPVNFRFYNPENEFPLGKNDPNFKSKLDHARDLILDAINKKIKFHSVVFDGWYGNSSELLEFTHFDHHLHFITELNSDRNVQFYHPAEKKHIFLRADDLVKVVKKHYSHKLKPVKFKDQDGKPLIRWTYSFKSKLKGCSVPIKVVIMFGRWNKDTFGFDTVSAKT